MANGVHGLYQHALGPGLTVDAQTNFMTTFHNEYVTSIDCIFVQEFF